MATWGKSEARRQQRRSEVSVHKMDCAPKYSKVSESLRYVASGSVQCSMFCGGRQCKYEGQERWSEHEMAIKGLYSSWATDNILAMARPSTRTLKKFNVIQQFQRWGITAVINLQHPGEHANCGFGLEESGFTYNPQEFMDNGIFFFNFIWQDYGVRSLESILDIVKVMDFALQDGKVAVHCHAGLGRTGVCIACYLIYSSRITPEQAIHTVRIKRPRSVQTRGQISCVQDFAKFMQPLWIIFPSCYNCAAVKPFTLQKYLVRQKHVLHGYEARELKFIPKIIFVCCKRLLQLCGLDYSKLRLTNHRLRGKPGDDVDTTDGSDELDSCMNDRNEGSNESTCDISASMEDLKGEVDTENVSSNDECDGLSEKLTDSQTSACMSFENDTEIEKSSRRKSDSALCLGGKQRDSVGNKISLGNKPMVENTLESHEGNALPNKDNLNNEISKLNQLHNASDSYANQEGCGMMTSENAGKEHVTVDDVARAFSVGPNEVMDKVQSIQRLLNESNEGWNMVAEETNPCVLTTLMITWIDCLMEPVFSLHDVETLVENSENTQEALLRLSKSQRGICECLLVTIFKLSPLDKELREGVLLKILTILTQSNREARKDDSSSADKSRQSETETLISSKVAEFLKFCMLLYEKWLKEVN